MKRANLCALSTAAALAFPVLGGEPIPTARLTLVDENKATLTISGVEYQLNSYIIPFQQPYYVHVKRTDGRPIEKETAVGVASSYIQPRGCTEPIKRLEKLDRNNSDKTEWLIGIAC